MTTPGWPASHGPCTEATGEEAWTTFCAAVQEWGLPAGVLSDNGLCFSGKLHGFEVLFEARLRDAGIRPITGRPYHPQTTGKVERFQQTLKKWLRRQDHRHGLARDLAELQARLDAFRRYYNEQRPHQGIGRVTPGRGGRPRRRPSPPTHRCHTPNRRPAPNRVRSPSTTAVSPSSTGSASVSAANGPAARSPSSSTAPTPPCSTTDCSCATCASTAAAATNPPADHAAAPANHAA